jgi:hypothetical protein
VIWKINLWRGLEDFVAEDVAQFEEWLYCVCALCNLEVLAKSGRLEAIPKDEPPGAQHRCFSGEEVLPLPAVKFANSVPPHVQRLLDDGPEFSNNYWMRCFCPTPLERAKSRRQSAYLLQINCCMLASGQFIVMCYSAASSQSLTYLSGILCDCMTFFLKTACSCSIGNTSIKDDDSGDERPQRGVEEKGGCSHIACLCDVLSDLQTGAENLHLVVRKHKGPHLDAHLRFIPLKHGLSQLEEAKKRVYLAKTPLDDPQPTPICICRKGEDKYVGAVILECRICEEKYHHLCLAMKKNAAKQVQDDWCCGFCIMGKRDAQWRDNDEDDVADAGDGNLGEEEMWVIAKIPRKKKGRAKAVEAENVTYHCLWTETPAYLRKVKCARVVEHRGIASWDELSELIQAEAKKNMEAMKRLKDAATQVLKQGGHHVSDTIGVHGPQQASVTAEVIDALADAGLLDEEQLVARDE